MAVYRVTVRGRFTGLSDGQRKSLRDRAAEHDIFQSAFNGEGTLSYDASVDFFSFRREVRFATAGSESEACDLAVESAEQFLKVLGYGHTPLNARAMDMSAMTQRGRERSLPNP